MSRYPIAFTQDGWRAATKLAAPYQQLLGTDPLWLTTGNPYTTANLLTAHATMTCPELPPNTTDLPVLDPGLRFFKEAQPPLLGLCSCTMRPDSSSPAGYRHHPLRHMSLFSTRVTDLMSSPQDGGPHQVLVGETTLHFARRCAHYTTAYATGRPELTFLTDWLAATLASGARHLDAMRAHQREVNQIRSGPDDVLAAVDLFDHVGVALTADEDPLGIACPIEVRLELDSVLVVRAPATLTGQRWPARRRAPVILGRVRPMDAHAWHLYEQLVRAGHDPVPAYAAAADSVTQLDANSRKLLDPLIAAGVPASELINTATELAR